MDKNTRERFWKEYLVEEFNGSDLSEKLSRDDYSESDSHYMNISPAADLKKAMNMFGISHIGFNIAYNKLSVDLLFYNNDEDNLTLRDEGLSFIRNNNGNSPVVRLLEIFDKNDIRNTGYRIKYKKDITLSEDSFEVCCKELIKMFKEIRSLIIYNAALYVRNKNVNYQDFARFILQDDNLVFDENFDCFFIDLINDLLGKKEVDAIEHFMNNQAGAYSKQIEEIVRVFREPKITKKIAMHFIK